VDALWRAGLRPARLEQLARDAADCARIDARGVGGRGRRTTPGRACRSGGSRWPCCSHEWPRDTTTLRWSIAAACPEGDAVCGCESLISKWHCVRSRFRTVLKSGSGLSVVALRAAAFSAPRGAFLSRRVCSEHGR
jgi:hypothetical protein